MQRPEPYKPSAQEGGFLPSREETELVMKSYGRASPYRMAIAHAVMTLHRAISVGCAMRIHGHQELGELLTKMVNEYGNKEK